MQRAVLSETALDGHGRRGDFPFALGRQPCARPARIGVGLEQADVAHRCMAVDRLHPMQGELARPVPAVQRRGDAIRIDPIPALGKPQLGAAITVIRDECGVFGVGHRPARERKCR